jgi:hypothetical protein
MISLSSSISYLSSKGLLSEVIYVMADDKLPRRLDKFVELLYPAVPISFPMAYYGLSNT